MTSLASRQSAAQRPALELPREHGFWVMLSAVVLAAVSAYPSLRSLLAAALVVGAGALLGSLVHRRIRRQPRLQLASSLVLAAAGVPIELAGGAPWVPAIYDATAWVAVFAAFTLSVWACTARSSRIRRPQVRDLTTAAIGLPLVAAVGLALAGHRGHAAAALLGAAASSIFALWRPGAKQMKPIGLTLAGVALLVALVLIVV
ncbi:MAG TPA: hypothetical protein VFV94_04685 [Polyangiaceae bacterium]|nr:hypothetical protein [Polyangiaceae bacterium]